MAFIISSVLISLFNSESVASYLLNVLALQSVQLRGNICLKFIINSFIFVQSPLFSFFFFFFFFDKFIMLYMFLNSFCG